MTTEKPLQDEYMALLKSLKIPFIHLPNRMFGKYRTSECLKYFPDLDFQFNGKRHQREFGIKGRHTDRKQKQLEKMKEYGKRGADIKIIFTREAMMQDWQDIGLISD